MNLLTAAVLILSAILTSTVVFVGGQTVDGTSMEVNGQKMPVQTNFPGKNQTPAPTPAPAETAMPVETPHPEPTYIPDLSPYVISKDHDIWHAQDPTSYITPEDDWVKYYASLLYIDHDGRLRYKDTPVPLEVDTKGNVLYWIDKALVNNYIHDSEQFPSSPDNDMWVKPAYYLTHGMKDDCDGWMAAVTSLMLSGEISVKENGRFVKKVIPAKAVLGYMSGYRDGWTEYQAYGKTFLTTTSLVRTGIGGTEKISSTEFVDKNYKTTAKPVFEFNNRYFGLYSEW